MSSSVFHERLARELDVLRDHGHEFPQTPQAYAADWIGEGWGRSWAASWFWRGTSMPRGKRRHVARKYSASQRLGMSSYRRAVPMRLLALRS
ncbi:MAG: hypothetical protein CVU19_01800 [Betaproteobacteria bacterium HGW-Betaproteobacteria-13]|nr:MAG: hypothetical protein CVU28_03615 [Betaproteobacteria bacterium HGW-Betaproteobacteria-21]PKO82375.1 MAG: hypothetical protein CVU19_01800 [Betaproteobacteria bacterium HGW-Betaproteobacteria-13]